MGAIAASFDPNLPTGPRQRIREEKHHACFATAPHLSLARDRKPRHSKKSPRYRFSCGPITPVAGKALRRPLAADGGERWGKEQR